MRTLTPVVATVLGFALFAYADGNSEFAQSSERPPPPVIGAGQPLDPRLPPTIPGQEVSDGERTMRVWSSSGPVPVAQPPEPFESRKERKITDSLVGQGLDVIVDQRRRQPAGQLPPKLPAEGSFDEAQ